MTRQLTQPPPPQPPAADEAPPIEAVDATTAGLWIVRVLAAMVILLVLVNIPVNIYGRGLAHLIPERSGIVVQEESLFQADDGRLYLFQEHKLRPVSSPEAAAVFKRYWQRPTPVDADFLARFEMGQPIRRWASCSTYLEPGIYALENDQKRLCDEHCIAQNFANRSPNARRPWDRVNQHSCTLLYNLPTGSPLSE